MKLSGDMLIESKSARDEGLSIIVKKTLPERILGYVKDASFVEYQGKKYLTSRQVAEFYGISEDNVRQALHRNRAELESDGAKRLEGKELKEVRDIMSRTSFAPWLNLFTPRAVLRMGWMLRDSDVAAVVRTASLNIIEGVGDLFHPKLLDALIAGHTVLDPFCGSGEMVISVPLSQHYDSIERTLKKRFATGGVPGYTKEALRERLSALSTYTHDWKLGTQSELRYSFVDSCPHAKYPDLISQVIEINVDGQRRKVVFMFQVFDLIVEAADMETIIGRQYPKRAKESLGVDYAFLILTSPFGATPEAEEAIRRDLPSEMKGFVGVMTIKEVAAVLRDQAWRERKHGPIKGEINTQFSDILNYEIPVDPLLLLMSYQPSLVKG